MYHSMSRLSKPNQNEQNHLLLKTKIYFDVDPILVTRQLIKFN